ncbi:MAG: glycosyltransferase family 9 protein [Candidatus Cloacimonetes bacterium]|nr:glycosyltransferase family 9 protein [Candidatus Cloacimonadota bacterium]
MKINIIRKIDYWAGIPICFIFTIIHKICKLFNIHKKPLKKPMNILFVELSEMGSAILAYSSLQKARELFPGVQLFFLIFDENKESVYLTDIIPDENVFTINCSSFIKFLSDTLSVLWKIRKAKIDTYIDMELFSRATSIISYLSGANSRVGFYRYHIEGLYRGNFLTHKVSYNPHQHISLNFINLVYAIQSNLEDSPLLKKSLEVIPTVPRITSSKEAEKSIFSKLKIINSNIEKSSKIIIFNPNAGMLPIRAWPLEKYIQLAKKIIKLKDVFIVVMGINDASKDAELICNVSKEYCIDFTNRTTLKEVIDLFNISDVLVTNDSGPAHFASLTPIKNFVLFGPETPDLYSPLGENCIPLYAHFSCSPCVSAFNHRKTSCNDAKCMQAISVEQVYYKIIEVL